MNQGAQARRWLWRGSCLAAILIVELLVSTVSFDTRDLLKKPGFFTAFVERWAPGLLQAGIVFVLVFAGILYLRLRPELGRVLARYAESPVRLTWLLGHAATFAATFWLAQQFFSATPIVSAPPDLLAMATVLFGLAALILAAGAFAPLALYRDTAAAGGIFWLAAGLTALLASLSGPIVQRLWVPATELTFSMVKWLLLRMALPIVADASTATLGTDRFAVTIARQCSGLEGAGLFLVFGLVGLFVFRSDFRFPRALWLIPFGIAAMYVFNALRIAALIWIGHSGAADVALGGFHSQAGWISFNVVSLGIFAWARTSQVFGAAEPSHAPTNSPEDLHTDPAPYLMPFLTILGVGMLVRAVSGSFESLYPLKPLAAGLVLWHYRGYYRGVLDWTLGWTGVIAGVAVLVIWVAPEFWSSVTEPGRPIALAGMHPLWAWTWIAARVIGAVVTVPVAEELAFRGFLLRRFTSSDVDSVVPNRSMWLGIAVSSLVFGLLHGERWLTGILAGLVYAGVYVRTGRIGEAVLAHSVTNGLLVLLVLFFGTWRYW